MHDTQLIFTGHTAIFSPGVSDDMECIFISRKRRAQSQELCERKMVFAASMENEAFIRR
ncbi:hypothetical protein DFH09DRAFT_1307786 [Mycena vulgaris]|nr:hypothetical protein DFH09DRAFT_1307786 [Mycena vulgaris]